MEHTTVALPMHFSRLIASIGEVRDFLRYSFIFQKSTIPTFEKLNLAMESAKPSVYTDGNRDGIERVLKEDGGYAFFMEAAAIEYHTERICELTQIGGLLDRKGYGVALPPGIYHSL